MSALCKELFYLLKLHYLLWPSNHPVKWVLLLPLFRAEENETQRDELSQSRATNKLAKPASKLRLSGLGLHS